MAAPLRTPQVEEEPAGGGLAEGAVALVRATMVQFPSTPDVLAQACWHVSGLAREGVRGVPVPMYFPPGHAGTRS
mgnify:CR=1 FL=1